MRAYIALRSTAALASLGACRCVSPEARARGNSGPVLLRWARGLCGGLARSGSGQWLVPLTRARSRAPMSRPALGPGTSSASMARPAHSVPEPCINGSSRLLGPGAVPPRLVPHSGPESFRPQCSSRSLGPELCLNGTQRKGAGLLHRLTTARARAIEHGRNGTLPRSEGQAADAQRKPH